MTDKCAICGHPIYSEESIKRGYGSECASALSYATKVAIMQDDNNSLHYNWIIRVSAYREAMIDYFKNTKFRSDFKRNFYASICKSDRISKKQLSVIIDWLTFADFDIADMEKRIDDEKKDFISEKSKGLKLTPELIAFARKRIRK